MDITWSEDCLSHSPSLRPQLDAALRLLKGKVIPKRIFKRTTYLICDCKKKYTPLDAEIERRGLGHLRNDFWDSNSDLICVSASGEVDSPTDAGRHLLKTLATGSDPYMTRSSSRLLLICVLSAKQSVQLLEPRLHRQEATREFRDVTRSPYMRKKPKSERQKRPNYKFEDLVRLDLGGASLGLFVGRGGNGLKGITSRVPCQVRLNKDDTASVKTTSRENLFLLGSLLRERAAMIVERRAQRRYVKYLEGQEIWDPIHNIWDMAVGCKDAARDVYEVKQRHESSKVISDNIEPEEAEPEKAGQRPQSLAKSAMRTRHHEEAKRCLNCSTPHDVIDCHIPCRHHPGYLDKNGSWTCCGLSIVLTDAEGRLLSHATNGCATSIHIWRKRGDNARKRTKKSKTDD